MYSHVLLKKKWGESTSLSVQLKSEETGAMNAVERQKLLQYWSSCRDTHSEQGPGDTVYTATSGKKTGWRFMDAAALPSVSLLLITAEDWQGALQNLPVPFAAQTELPSKLCCKALSVTGFVLESQFIHWGQVAGLGLFSN